MEPSTSFLSRFSCAFNFLITPSDTYKATTPVKPITGSRNPSPTKKQTGSKTPFWTPYTHWGGGATDMETGTHALLTDWLQLSASTWNLPLGGSQEQCRSMIVKPRPVLFNLMSIKRAFQSATKCIILLAAPASGPGSEIPPLQPHFQLDPLLLDLPAPLPRYPFPQSAQYLEKK